MTKSKFNPTADEIMAWLDEVLLLVTEHGNDYPMRDYIRQVLTERDELRVELEKVSRQAAELIVWKAEFQRRAREVKERGWFDGKSEHALNLISDLAGEGDKT